MWDVYLPLNEYVSPVLSELSWERDVMAGSVKELNGLSWKLIQMNPLKIVFLYRKLTNTLFCFHFHWREKRINYSSFREPFRCNSWRWYLQIINAWQLFGNRYETHQWPWCGLQRHVYITVKCLLFTDPSVFCLLIHRNSLFLLDENWNSHVFWSLKVQKHKIRFHLKNFKRLQTVSHFLFHCKGKDASLKYWNIWQVSTSFGEWNVTCVWA